MRRLYKKKRVTMLQLTSNLEKLEHFMCISFMNNSRSNIWSDFRDARSMNEIFDWFAAQVLPWNLSWILSYAVSLLFDALMRGEGTNAGEKWCIRKCIAHDDKWSCYNTKTTTSHKNTCKQNYFRNKMNTMWSLRRHNIILSIRCNNVQFYCDSHIHYS